MCFACQEKGDAIDFIAKIEQVDKLEAARRIIGNGAYSPTPVVRAAPEPPQWRALLPAPADAPPMDPAKVWNAKRDKWTHITPTRRDEYRDAAGQLLGYVLRADIEGRKWTPTVTYAEHADGRRAWALVPFPVLRPLQGLDALARRPQAPVLVVSGEKCRDVATRTLPGFVVVTWPGGDDGVDKANWEPLQTRTSVTLWPDADQSGVRAMERIATRLHGPQVRFLDVSGLEQAYGKGADIADLVAAGLDTGQVVAWARDRVRPYSAPPAETPPEGGAEPGKPARVSTGNDGGNRAPVGGTARSTPPANPKPAISDAPSATPGIAPAKTGEIVDLPPTSKAYNTLTNWATLGLELSDKGVPHPNLDNAAALLERHPDTQGRFWFDEFLQRVLSTWNIEHAPKEWSDADDVRLALWMQRRVKIGRMSVGTARDAVTAIALAHKRNECREWLESLTWDGTDRLAAMISAGFGAESNEYTAAVGRCWMVSMVARALNPGCKVDTMPVFEGDQGRGKSTALQALVGARWFAEAAESPTNKDFFQALQGKLLVEIGEMDAFSKAEVHTIKRVISCQVDRYRAPYGRRSEDHPRQGVFAGTTNKDDWNRDETGARRFWPVACTTLDLAWLATHREQLFAEAVARYQAGESWWDVPEADAKREQEARRDADEWERIVDSWLVGRWETTTGDVLSGALKIEADKWDRSLQLRAARCLKVLGWKRTTARRGNTIVKVWQAPAGSTGAPGGNTGNEILL